MRRYKHRGTNKHKVSPVSQQALALNLSSSKDVQGSIRIQMFFDTFLYKGKRTVEIHILVVSIVMQWKIQRPGNFSVLARTGKSTKVIDEEIKQTAVQPPPSLALSSKFWAKTTPHIVTVCPGKGAYSWQFFAEKCQLFSKGQEIRKPVLV